jgi:ubiquinone/menaquinone biosynthesis C-methylase UbiE
MDQRKVYNHKKITSDYASRDYIDNAEVSIIKELKPFLKDMSMLDMGVGAGRTTKYFMPLVNSYIGADYAPNMIEECRKKYRNKKIFEVIDVRDMRKFADDMFDFVLFSYNGIDSFDEKGRKTALKEIKRVLKSNGFFAFSSHNIDWSGIYDIFRLKGIFVRLNKKIQNQSGFLFIKKIQLIFKAVYYFVRLNILNKRIYMTSHINHLRKEGCGILADNSLDGKVKIFYSSYDYQVNQLKEYGFKDIKAFSINGMVASEKGELDNSAWIYYLCRIKK